MHRLESLEFCVFFYVCLIKFKNNQILSNKIGHRFPLTTTEVFSSWKSLIERRDGRRLRRLNVGYAVPPLETDELVSL
jgi:hypothetical protein